MQYVVADLIDAITAWKLWGFREEPDLSLSLFSDGGPLSGTPWPKGEWFEAVCPEGHVPPADGCSCGLYAVKSPKTLTWWNSSPGGLVLGKIALAGEVLEHTTGYKAQYGRPIEFVKVRPDRRFPHALERLSIGYRLPQ
jgi:hypothetical protein